MELGCKGECTLFSFTVRSRSTCVRCDLECALDYIDRHSHETERHIDAYVLCRRDPALDLFRGPRTDAVAHGSDTSNDECTPFEERERENDMTVLPSQSL